MNAKNLKRIELKNLEGTTHSCIVVKEDGTKHAKEMPASEFGAFLKNLFLDWGKRDPSKAIAEATRLSRQGTQDSRYLAWMWVAMSIAFPGMLGLGLLADGYQNMRCTKALETAKMADGRLLKVKKNRRGNFTWDLEFTTAAGNVIKGRRVPFTFDEQGHPLPEGFTVLYSDHDADCWDVSVKKGEIALNQRQRLFTRWMTIGFGYTFCLIALLGLLWGVRKLRFRNPYGADLERVAEELISTTRPDLKTN